MLWLYNLALFFYHQAIYLAAAFHPKARQWVEGRKHIFEQIPQGPHHQLSIWMHCASLGEFEQGRPIIESLRQQLPNCFIVLSFYSPSGYEIRKNYAQVDHVCYLPTDTATHAYRFIEKMHVDLAIFVKYEFWYHHLSALHQARIPTVLIAALFRPQQVFFRFYGGFFRTMLHQFDQIFLQNQSSVPLLENIQIQRYQVVGDPRVDRVLQNAQSPQALPLIENFAKGHRVIVAGSTWPEDERLLLPFINQHLPSDWKVIIAPHEIHPKQLSTLEAQLQLPHQRYSAAQQSLDSVRVLIIDNIGLLAMIYRYGHLAYIGGGFGRGIHNTLEPAAFGLPLLFGPKYQSFTEAVTLVEDKGAFVIKEVADFQKVFVHLQSATVYEQAQQAINNYLNANRGATEQIVNCLTLFIM
ncbi:MAG: glycosyltransferase N-terminal domain-containing protein, partial [Bacteroidota bacterium]